VGSIDRPSFWFRACNRPPGRDVIFLTSRKYRRRHYRNCKTGSPWSWKRASGCYREPRIPRKPISGALPTFEGRSVFNERIRDLA